MNASEALSSISKASSQKLRRLVGELREKFPNVPRQKIKLDFPKVSQHLTLYRQNVSRLADQIQDEDRARLLDPTGPKILKGKNPHRRPKTAIISIAAQRAYEKRMAREKFEAAMASLATQRRA